MFVPDSGRRDFLGQVLLAGSACWAGQAEGREAAGFDVSAWKGPVGNWQLPDTAGRMWGPADLKGRAVLINFWASWCEPCRAEMPSLQQLADHEGASRLLVLAVNFKEPAARALQFAQASALRLPLLLDTSGQVARSLDVKVFPTTLTVSSQGQPRHRLRGEVDWASPAARHLVTSLFAR